MAKHTQTILPTNCLSVFDHFVGLALKGLSRYLYIKEEEIESKITNEGIRMTGETCSKSTAKPQELRTYCRL